MYVDVSCSLCKHRIRRAFGTVGFSKPRRFISYIFYFKGYMKKIIETHGEMAEELPMIHTSLCEHLPNILLTDSLNPQQCHVFNESLVYLFYGRPAYRSSRGTNSGDAPELCPVCFVFKPRTVSQNIHRVYPCDSGAISNNLFSPEILSADLDDLALEPIIESARKVVNLFFEHNSNYFVGKVATGKNFRTGNIEARFYNLLRQKGPAGYDDRKSAIEVQTNTPVSLTNSLLFVVLPENFLDDDIIRGAIINTWNCDPITYATIQGDPPADYYTVIREKVKERFEKATRI